MSTLVLPLLLALLGPPEIDSSSSRSRRNPTPTLALPPQPERRAKRLFIASGALMGVSLIGEMAGAIVSTNCEVGNPCTVGAIYDWGSDDAGTRYTLITTGTGSAYVLSRVLSVPLVWSAEGLLLAGAHARGIADGQAGVVSKTPKRLAWGLLGSGLGVYAASRLARVGFAVAGVCQEPGCLYTFDQLSLGVSRGLSFSGSALVMHRRTQRRVILGVAPMGYGASLTGQF